MRCEDGALRTVDPLLPVDMQYIGSPRFTIAGYAKPSPTTGRTILHPVDYFDTLKEFRHYLRASNAPPYPERIEKLRRFQQANLLTQITTDYIGLAHREEEVLPEVVKVMEGAAHEYIMLTDGNTLMTGQAHAVEVRSTCGIIDGFWGNPGVVDGENGFRVWFNGELFNVAFSFCGRNNSLLNNISLVRGKLLEFLYIKMGITRIGVGRKVLWDTPAWRPKRLRGSALRIEKCALCGDTKSRHARRGICQVCETNLYRFFAQYGPDFWITPASGMAGKRRRTAWEPSLLNAIKFRLHGHLLEAREDGCWRFTSQPQETEKQQ
jgi:hypothetical protein